MAEFKLGRIRFIWKGDWAPSTVYYKDDIIRNGGNTYVCISGHTALSLFTTDQEVYWNKISDGTEWKSNWLTNTYYKVNDIVKYGGYLYIANQGHTSSDDPDLGLEDDQEKWDLFCEGFDYKEDWDTDTRYKINDVVKYNGTVYICIQEHKSATTNALGLEDDAEKWNIFSEGFYWSNTWLPNTRYRKNDTVRYGGQLYVCNEGHTSAVSAALGLEDDQGLWDYLHKGIEYKGDWTGPNIRYKVNDVVKYGGGIWICKTYHTSQTYFTQDEAKWEQFVEGLEFEDSWSNSVRYQPGDFVTYGGYSYVAITNNLASTPTSNPLDWDLFTTGFNFTGDWSGSTPLYKVGDVVRLYGYTYLCTADHSTAHRPPNLSYWERLNSGMYWKNTWANASVYDAGDTVKHGVNSYICILAHTADQVVAQNRPDQDVVGTYWNLLTAGAESGNLTTLGDLVYYGGAGATRLPIGSPGQVLKVNAAGNAPQWDYFGQINNVYYVSTGEGVDLPAPGYGKTLDRPWKSVRYATEQVLKGAMRPNARTLLEKNRSFIAAEVKAWVAAQIAAGTGIWSGFTNPSPTKCERDMGQIIDALAWDISHGGNARTRAATLSYFSGVTLLAAILAEKNQTVAAINYLATVIDAVISNVAPAASYQGTITRVTDTSIPEETDAQSVITSLITVITAAITANSNAGIPAEVKAQDTIFVKTGTFSETLPIIIPENCAIVGDELRSTKISPAGSLIAGTDVPKTLGTINRLQAIVSNIIQNIAITRTTGNTSTQVTTRPAGSSPAGTAAAAKVTNIYNYINFKINAAGSLPSMTGTNTPETSTGYTYACEVLEANRQFIKDEITAFIAFTYSGYTYNAAYCLRDVDRYIDALKYDLIYTGNYKSLLAARYYVNAVNGSVLEDMFYMRNGTGLRNCTTIGLTGSLGAANAYGTKRPTAGAFVSLDPGFGTTDTAVWITTRSPYVQNVTTFGTACIGLKVDGNLHSGGNDSIVANDFTQVISDGIGAWVTNLGRAELVSVFSYYAHIGYLAEAGGKIRATNGNSSYGDYGTVAEGVDSTETATTGTVNNYANEALVARVLTDGNNILTLEYSNAGVGYTAGAGATISLAGEGYGAVIASSQVTTTGGVFEVRMLETGANFGGAGYVARENVAQEGTSTAITLSNTDPNTVDAAYVGLSVYITGGRGAGQYGYIQAYNNGTKVATIYKHSTDTAGWDHVTGLAIQTTLNATTAYSIEPRITFSAPASALYADTAKGRAVVRDNKVVQINIWDPGTGYASAPTLTITDPNNTGADAPTQVRIGNGVLKQPTWTNRGTAFTTASATVTGVGYADLYQPGEYINLSGLTAIPVAGSNVTFGAISGTFYKLVSVRNLTGSTGNYAAQLQVSPALTITNAPANGSSVEVRRRYSQVRLTGHDFLDVGTGNIANTNYPGLPLVAADPNKETVNNNGGRVFYTSTDQDGNFRVGRLFNVEQSTGVATLNANAFSISGLQELQLGAVSLGGTGAVITEFSTDGTFTANSDNIVPTQKAIKTYITSQIGGGAGELNVSSITAGSIQISTNVITTTTGSQINILQKVNFTGGVDGDPVALNYFLLG